MPSLELAPVWDKVTRLWHWAFAVCVIAGWLLGEFRNFETVQWHFYAGYVTAGLLLWRFIWGFIGPEPVRFGTLLPNLKSIVAYLSGIGIRQPSGIAGHTPLGGVSIVVMLLMLTFQVLSGLFVEDDTLFAAGPLAYDIDPDLSEQLKTLHNINAKLILVLVGLHLGAIIFYRYWKKEDLVSPMITGMKWVKKE
jgi:cytochrome b